MALTVKTSRSLTQTLLRRVIIGYLLFALSVMGLQLYVEYRHARQETLRSLNALARAFAPGAALALRNHQEELLQSLTQGIGAHELVEAAGISDIHGRINASWRASSKPVAASELMVQQKIYHRLENGDEELLGILTITSSTGRAFASLGEDAQSASLAIAAQLLFLAGMLAALAQQLVVKPLQRFAGQIDQATAQDPTQSIDLNPLLEVAEIAAVQQSFNQRLRRIAERHALISAANAALEQRIVERTHNLDQRNHQLAREHQFTLALVRSIPGLVCILDEAGHVLIANHAAETLIGCPGLALTGQHWSSLPTLAVTDHPLHKLFEQVYLSGTATAQARFAQDTGPQRAYQFEALRVGNDTDARIIVVGVDITEQYQHTLRLQHQAFHDRLTGLPNRALFLERLEQTLRGATRRNNSFAVAFIDLDRFKPINDSAGHEAGDAVLCEIASRLRRCVRENDTVARQGGDEFVLLLLDSTQPGLRRVAEAVLKTVVQPIYWQDAVFTVSASIGFAVFPEDGASLEELLSTADGSMYRAKQAGRNQADFGETRQADAPAR